MTEDYKIFGISFRVSEENYKELVRQISIAFGLAREFSEGAVLGRTHYHWIDSETYITADPDGWIFIFWQPLQKDIWGYAEKRKDPAAFMGVTLGSKVEDYAFIKEAYREGPEIIHYVSEISPPDGRPDGTFVAGAGIHYVSEISPPDGVESYLFSAYKGAIYGLKLVSNKNVRSGPEEMVAAMRLLDFYDDGFRYLYFWGSARLDTLFSSRTALVRLVPLCWNVNRARIAYYRNLKPD